MRSADAILKNETNGSRSSTAFESKGVEQNSMPFCWHFLITVCNLGERKSHTS